MLRASQKYLMWAVWSLFAAGCGDPVRTTLQLVQLRVVDLTSGQPVVGAQLLFKDDFEAAHPLDQTQLTREEWDYYKSLWEQRRWFRGDTDADGKAWIVVQYTCLDRSRGSQPPAWRDWVSGKPFIVRVKKGQTPSTITKLGESPEDRVSMVMESGASAKARTVTVTVLEIQEPRYGHTN
jgi:hypothetical protein